MPRTLHSCAQHMVLSNDIFAHVRILDCGKNGAHSRTATRAMVSTLSGRSKSPETIHDAEPVPDCDHAAQRRHADHVIHPKSPPGFSAWSRPNSSRAQTPDRR